MSEQTFHTKRVRPQDAGDFWDEYGPARLRDSMREVEFELWARHQRCVPLQPEVYREIEAQARARGMAPEALINGWLAERLHTPG